MYIGTDSSNLLCTNSDAKRGINKRLELVRETKAKHFRFEKHIVWDLCGGVDFNFLCFILQQNGPEEIPGGGAQTIGQDVVQRTNLES